MISLRHNSVEFLTLCIQHYGFVFNYKTIMIDYSKPTPSLPLSCESLAEQMVNETSHIVEENEIISLKDDAGKLSKLNQLTINEYLPGQGIASHTGQSRIASKRKLE